MSKSITPAPASTGANPPSVTAPFGSLQHVNPQELERTIEQMYFQGKNVTPEQKTIFRHAILRTGLDPIVGQIRPVLREDKRTKTWNMAIQTSIDGYRLIADRTGKYAGSDEPVYDGEESGEYEDKEWYDAEGGGRGTRSVKKAFEHPIKASVTVWKLVDGSRCAFTASARWTEYYPGNGAPGFMWRKMPYLMLAKCAEALALRKAFPADLSGIYTDDEMQQASGKEEKPVVVVPTMTKQAAMEILTEVKTIDELRHAYIDIFACHWTWPDGKEVSDCMLNVLCNLKRWTRQGTNLCDETGAVTLTVTFDPTTGKAIMKEPENSIDLEKPIEVEMEEEKAMADAERKGMQTA